MDILSKFKIITTDASTAKVDESEGRLFYTLWQFMCSKAYRLYKSKLYEGLGFQWNETTNFSAYSVEDRLVVSDLLLTYYNQVLHSIQNPTNKTEEEKDKNLLRQTSNIFLSTRTLSKLGTKHLDQMKKWETTRVEGQFWYLGSTKYGGAFAYFGNSNYNKNNSAEMDENDNINEIDDDYECVFIVKGLASSFKEILGNATPHDPELPGLVFET